MHKKIHGEGSDIEPFIDGHQLGVEDLSRTTKEIPKDDRGKAFNAKMSAWIHGKFGEITTHHHPDAEPHYTRGTSRFRPFDSTPLTHPGWGKSKCGTCDRTHDGDWLESVSGLIRTMPPRHGEGQPWKTAGQVLPEAVARRLQDRSTLLPTPTDVGMGTSPGAGVPSSPFAPNVPSAVQPPSAIGTAPRGDAMLENRDDAYGGSLKKLNTTQGLREDTHHGCGPT
jgi:hypothetical protein